MMSKEQGLSKLWRTNFTEYVLLLGILFSRLQNLTAMPLNVVFGDVAQLESVSISGMPLRVELRWRTLNTAQTSYKIFAHVLDAQGRLAAQRDNIPQNGFAPTDTWKRDQLIVDRFALPQTLPSGTYIIKVGLYDPLTNERVLTADNLDSIEVSRFTLP
jgi:hypothetical protein